MKALRTLLMAALLAGASAAGAATTTTARAVSDAEIAEKLAREIRMYPRYTIWDNVKLRVEDGHVELLGEVSQPFKKDDLTRLAQRTPGVESVANQLKVLPLSAFDDRLRFQVARAIYGDTVLSRYGLGVNPSIHIVVENGHVKLEGVVDNEADKNIAGIRASSAGLSFGPVINNLRVANQTPSES